MANRKLYAAVVKLPAPVLEQFKASKMYEPGDENAPFLSERFLYPLLGKDEARRVLQEVGYYG